MTKRYTLLKDLPDSKPGDIYIWNDSQKSYYKDGNVLDSYWMKESVEGKPDWFQEIKEPERIEVTSFQYKGCSDHGNWYMFHIASTPEAPRPKIKSVPAIKQAIENVLNDDENYTKFLEYLSLEETYRSQRVNMLKELISKDKTYTQEQLNEEIEKAFGAARIYRESKGGFFSLHPGYFKHSTFQDYLSSLKK